MLVARLCLTPHASRLTPHASPSAARERWSLRRLAGRGDLGDDALAGVSVVATGHRAVIDHRVLFFGLIGEAGRSAHLAAEPHLLLVVRAEGDRRLGSDPAEDDVERTLLRNGPPATLTVLARSRC